MLTRPQVRLRVRIPPTIHGVAGDTLESAASALKQAVYLLSGDC